SVEIFSRVILRQPLEVEKTKLSEDAKEFTFSDRKEIFSRSLLCWPLSFE
ncbi:1797_t:CDS:1, partial [Dentiscutata heterogama]